jgi:hypothetical protein
LKAGCTVTHPALACHAGEPVSRESATKLSLAAPAAVPTSGPKTTGIMGE